MTCTKNCCANQLKAPSTPATTSKQHSTLLPQTAAISSFRQSRNKLNMFNLLRNFVRNCCRNRQHCCLTAKNVEATFDFVERIVQLVAFDDVAWTLLLVCMGLKTPGFSAARTSDTRIAVGLRYLFVSKSTACWRHYFIMVRS